MSKQNKQLVYSIGVIVVLIGVLYAAGVLLQHKGAMDAPKWQAEASDSPTVGQDTSSAEPSHNMYLGMKDWTWVKTKNTSGATVMPQDNEAYTLSLNFQSGKYTLTTECGAASGLFAAKSGVVAFGSPTGAKDCKGAAATFMSQVQSAQSFLFVTEKNEMVLNAKDGSQVVFK